MRRERPPQFRPETPSNGSAAGIVALTPLPAALRPHLLERIVQLSLAPAELSQHGSDAGTPRSARGRGEPRRAGYNQTS
jgi:hypothetical protein